MDFANIHQPLQEPIESMDKTNLFSRRQAARTLGVNPVTLDKLTRIHNLTVRQIPGVRRRYFVRAEILALLAQATGARD
jgi:hypothetical protein